MGGGKEGENHIDELIAAKAIQKRIDEQLRPNRIMKNYLKYSSTNAVANADFDFDYGISPERLSSSSSLEDSSSTTTTSALLLYRTLLGEFEKKPAHLYRFLRERLPIPPYFLFFPSSSSSSSSSSQRRQRDDE